MQIGIVTGSEIKKNKDGKNNVRMLQCTLTDPKDVQSVEWAPQPGDDSPPAIESAVFIVSVTESYKIAFAVDDKVTPTMEPGEKKLYSVDGTTIKAFINFLQTGILEINGNADFAVRYNALNAILQQLAIDINANLTAIATAIGGAYTPTPIVITATTAKIDEVKVP